MVRNKKKEQGKEKTREKREYKIIKLNNRSRKGTYLYLNENGKRAYYKIKEGQPIEHKLKHFRTEYKTTTERRKGAQKKAPQIEIEKQLRRSRKDAIINNIYEIDGNGIKKKAEQMLSKAVKDKDILKVIATEQNVAKIRDRIEHKIELKDEQGRTLATANRIGVTPWEAIRQLKSEIKQGEKTGRGKTDEITNKLEGLAWKNARTTQMGTIHSIKMTITFRKA